MKVNQTMLHILSELRRLESRRARRFLDVPLSQMGNQLIKFYYHTSDKEARQLVIEFMQEAGFEWTRKLIMRETDGESSPPQFTGLSEYTRLLAANDPSQQWFKAS